MPSRRLCGQDNPPMACAGLPEMKLWQSVKQDAPAGHPQRVPTYRRIPAVGNCRVSAILRRSRGAMTSATIRRVDRIGGLVSGWTVVPCTYDRCYRVMAGATSATAILRARTAVEQARLLCTSARRVHCVSGGRTAAGAKCGGERPRRRTRFSLTRPQRRQLGHRPVPLLSGGEVLE
jgi:hypothetical protein